MLALGLWAVLAFSPGLHAPAPCSSGLAFPWHCAQYPERVAQQRCHIIAFEDGSKPRSDEEVVAIFKEFDTSGDGFIDVGELEAALQKAGKPVTRSEAAKILEQVDDNGDGQISLDEFKAVFKLNAGSVPDVLKGLANVLDLFSVQGLVSDLGLGGQWRTTEGGARYVDDLIGDGALVVPGDFVQLHYTVTAMATSQVMETSRRGAGLPLGYLVGEADGTVANWDDAIVGMRIGGQRRVYVTPAEEDQPALRYDIEVVALESESFARREKIIAALGGRRAVTRAIFALTFIPYFLPSDKLPPLLETLYEKGDPAALEQEAAEEKVARSDQYIAKSLDALFPPN